MNIIAAKAPLNLNLSKSNLRIKNQNEIAMLVVIISFSMLFATLFLGFALYRVTAEVWPPGGITKISLFIPTVSSIFILISSLFFHLYKRSFEAQLFNKAKAHYGMTLLCGLLFVVSQFSLWKALKELGIFASSGIYSSVLYGFTWIHTAHMILGLLGLFYLGFLFFSDQKFNNNIKIDNIGKFWHFLGVVWLIMYGLLFVL